MPASQHSPPLQEPFPLQLTWHTEPLHVTGAAQAPCPEHPTTVLDAELVIVPPQVFGASHCTVQLLVE